jgi:hypothetical protein
LREAEAERPIVDESTFKELVAYPIRLTKCAVAVRAAARIAAVVDGPITLSGWPPRVPTA